MRPRGVVVGTAPATSARGLRSGADQACHDAVVLVLLPPSEGKTPARSGRPLDLGTLSSPSLTPARSRVVTALVRLAADDPARARRVLRLSERQTAELTRDAHLLDEPAAPASSVYTGVLFDALDHLTLSPAAKRRAARDVVVFSGLFGMLRLTDRIPAYRLSGDTDLPGVGPLPAHWRGPLDAAMHDIVGHRIVLDLRSGAYAALWRPAGDLADRVVTARVVQEVWRGGGTARVVVSHHNKATKGRLVRALLESGTAPRTVDGLIAACQQAGYRVEPGPDPRPGSPHTVDIVVSSL